MKRDFLKIRDYVDDLHFIPKESLAGVFVYSNISDKRIRSVVEYYDYVGGKINTIYMHSTAYFTFQSLETVVI